MGAASSWLRVPTFLASSCGEKGSLFNGFLAIADEKNAASRVEASELTTVVLLTTRQMNERKEHKIISRMIKRTEL